MTIIKMKYSLLTILFSILQTLLFGQEGKTPDKREEKIWPENFSYVEIKSSADGSIQKAWIYRSVGSDPMPLIVSLHTWSGDYNQEDPLIKEIILRNWNYIHPDFRGINKTPQSCGSDLVVSDIEDAILFAVEYGNVDTSDVHIIGVSGGGYATLVSFMKLAYPVRSFNAWASISNLDDWYWESKGRDLNYASDLEMVTSSGNGFNKTEAEKRSPVFMRYSQSKREGSFLNIYAGIHDGYTGSVPISHSINIFNKLVRDIYPDKADKTVTDREQISLLVKRINPAPENDMILGGRKVHLYKELPNLSLTLFEGGHEMIVPQALTLIPAGGKAAYKHQKFNILTIGDSNGAGQDGWPEQLKRLLPYSTIVNKSLSGNTIGFDNLGQQNLNTLKNIDSYLEEAYNQLCTDSQIDFICICLGTNDTKRVFIDHQKEVPDNMLALIQKIRQNAINNNKRLPKICIITPPPMDEQKLNKDKYGGGDKRVQKNNKEFKSIAKENNIDFLDIYSQLKKDFNLRTTDGIHLNTQTQFQLATALANYLNQK